MWMISKVGAGDGRLAGADTLESDDSILSMRRDAEGSDAEPYN